MRRRNLFLIAAAATLLAVPAVRSGLPSPDGSAGDDVRFRGEPEPLGVNAPRLGEWIPDLAVTTLDGTTLRLSEAAGARGLVIAMRQAGCPVSGKQAPNLARLERMFTPRGIGFLYVNPVDQPLETMRAETTDYGFAAPYAADPDGTLVGALDAKMSTEVFVLDAARTLVYRGAIDDQYGIGYAKPAPTREYLREALEALTAGRPVAVPATTSPGCYLSLDDAVETPRPEVTYHNRISRILQRKCESCHRAGGAAPFALSTYRQVLANRSMIRWAVKDGVMPPFYVDPGYGPWKNDTSLTLDEEIDLLNWLEQGHPAGDAADAPLARTWTDGWTIDEPDYVVRMPETFTVPAEGTVDYQYFYVKTDLPEDRWIRQMEIRSTSAQVVHHVLIFLEGPELMEQLQARRRQVDDPRQDPEFMRLRRQLQTGVRGYFASTVPGQAGIVFPAGTGKKLPAGAWLKFQVHYTPNGKERPSRSEIGFVFSDRPDAVEVRTSSALDTQFVIPAGAVDHAVAAEYTFDEPAALLSLFPHTHLRGTRFSYQLAYPDGTVETVLPLTRYDFNWQLNYEFETPLEVPAGTVMRATAWYDNSENNPANPDPTVDVRFGEQTDDEMMIAYVNWIPLRAGAPRTARRHDVP